MIYLAAGRSVLHILQPGIRLRTGVQDTGEMYQGFAYVKIVHVTLFLAKPMYSSGMRQPMGDIKNHSSICKCHIYRSDCLVHDPFQKP